MKHYETGICFDFLSLNKVIKHSAPRSELPQPSVAHADQLDLLELQFLIFIL